MPIFATFPADITDSKKSKTFVFSNERISPQPQEANWQLNGEIFASTADFHADVARSGASEGLLLGLLHIVHVLGHLELHRQATHPPLELFSVGAWLRLKHELMTTGGRREGVQSEGLELKYSNWVQCHRFARFTRLPFLAFAFDLKCSTAPEGRGNRSQFVKLDHRRRDDHSPRAESRESSRLLA